MKETDLYAMMRRYLPGTGTRIENSISSGIFDVYWAANGCGSWVENKIQHGNRIRVRGTQMVWGLSQLGQGMANLFFLVIRDEVDVPRLYPALGIFQLCDLNVTDGEGHMLVSLKGQAPIAKGWMPITTVLMGA
jgi:hypothetical protein